MSAIALHGAHATPLRRPQPTSLITALFALIILTINMAIVGFATYVFMKPDRTDYMEPHSPYYGWPTQDTADADAS